MMATKINQLETFEIDGEHYVSLLKVRKDLGDIAYATLRRKLETRGIKVYQHPTDTRIRMIKVSDANSLTKPNAV